MTLTRQDRWLMWIITIMMHILTGSIMSTLWWMAWNFALEGERLLSLCYSIVAMYWTRILWKLIQRGRI